MLTATANFRLIIENITRTLERTAAKPDVDRQAEYSNLLASLQNLRLGG